MNSDTYATYLEWNDVLAAHFFCTGVAQEPVYLFVTEQLLDDIGGRLGGLDGFLAAIRLGPPGTPRHGLCQRALQVAEGWRAKGYPYPPYVAYLSLFVLAGGHEGDFDPRSYYPRFWDLLGEPGDGTPPSFYRMWELWYDLEQWSVGDKRGERGLFEVRVAGQKIHIGLPLAQTMLTEEERRALPRIFADAGLEPGASPSNRELRRAVAAHGRYALRRRTLRALEGSTSSFTDGLLDAVAHYFVDWDGTVPDTPGRPASSGRITAGLRLSLRIDRVARRAQVALRCRTRQDIPDAALALEGAASGALTCEEFLPGWTGPLVSVTTGLTFVPPAPVWQQGLALKDAAASWWVRLHPAYVRVFVSGGPEQLPGLIETLEVPRGQPFYIAFHSSVDVTLRQWLESDCTGWSPFELDGLPPGWSFGAVEVARSDRGPRAVDARLSFPDRRTIRLVGGIAGDVRGDFFQFAPPQVLVDGALADDVVLCDGKPLNGDAASGWSLPASLPADRRLELEVKNGDEVLQRRGIQLVSGIGWRVNEPLAVLDPYGRGCAGGDRSVAGACVIPPVERALPDDLLRTPGLNPETPRVYFIGRCPGQVATFPEEELPEWNAVWVVPFGRRGKALFCGNSADDATPVSERQGDGEHLRVWHDVLWRRRKLVTPPTDRRLKELWRRYVDAAR